MKTIKKVLLTILIIVVILVLPLIFKDRSHKGFNAPELSEISYSEINFTNPKANLKLSGMLMLPEGDGPFPTAVIIQGSGNSVRGNGWYLSVVKHLQDNGIAVVIPDKRGSEKSEGEWKGASFDELAADALSAVEFIKAQDSLIDYSYLGFVGMSQGGWIAPLAASQTEDISYIASISGPTVTTDEQLLHEQIYNISPYTYEFIARLVAPLTIDGITKGKIFSAYTGFDPIPYLKKITIPVFYAFGENDTNVPVEACYNRLKENNLNNFKVETYPEGHGIVNPEARVVNQEFLNDLVQFIKAVKH